MDRNPNLFLFTDSVVPIEEVFFVPKASKLEYRSPQDLYSKTVVTHLGYHYPELQVHFDTGKIQRFDVSRDQDMFTFVLHGDRFDAAVADRLVGQWILKNKVFKTISGALAWYQPGRFPDHAAERLERVC